MIIPCTCPSEHNKFTPSEILRILHLPVSPATVSAIADRRVTHGMILSGRRYLSHCPHNKEVLLCECKTQAKHNWTFVDPRQEVFL